ncbi:hypothetical protein [Paenibacillus glucanolyticus]|uniref:hypothetical protein n=1 Tax=Paenibacillus glucanolyticus TaxID=59843 RepID=UPI00128C92BE|nr:hypothetical protein [Paenibacillus glucanolyticus]MPY18455.1 hypothetical protein [Paenibacillus glucanolyticus]
MFDPNIFDNLKVGIENVVYDLDNLDEVIHVIGRVDLLDMAVMSRSFSLRFELVQQPMTSAEIILETGLRDLATEILEISEGQPGCELKLRFYKHIADVSRECPVISQIVEEIWKPELRPVQTISYTYGNDSPQLHNTIELRFPRKINEEQMGDIQNMIEFMLRTLGELNRM